MRVRRDLAEEHIRANDLSVDELASLLGYRDAISFMHAFKRWTGMSVGQYRALCQAQDPSADGAKAVGAQESDASPAHGTPGNL